MAKVSFRKYYGDITTGDTIDQHPDSGYETKNMICLPDRLVIRPGCIKLTAQYTDGGINFIYSFRRAGDRTAVTIVGEGDKLYSE